MKQKVVWLSAILVSVLIISAVVIVSVFFQKDYQAKQTKQSEEQSVNASSHESQKDAESSDDTENIIDEYKRTIASYAEARYCLYDINKDDIPELLIEELPNRHVLIYSYLNGKSVKIGETEKELSKAASVPNKNGVIMITSDFSSEYPSTADFITLDEQSKLQFTNISDNGDIIIDGRDTGCYTDEIVLDGGDAAEILEGSEWLEWFSIKDTFMLQSYFKQYDDFRQVYKEMIPYYKEQFSHYALFDIDRDETPEMIFINYREVTNDDYKELRLDGYVYSVYDGKIQFCGYIDSLENFFACDEVGILCNNGSVDAPMYDLYPMKKRNMRIYGDKYLYGVPYSEDDGLITRAKYYFKDEIITPAEVLIYEKRIKRIEMYSIDDVTPLE